MFKVRLIKSKFILDFKLKSLNCFFFSILLLLYKDIKYKKKKKAKGDHNDKK